MVRVDTSREQFEVLSHATAQAGARKQGAEGVVNSTSGTTRVDTSRYEWEVLVHTKLSCSATKQGAEGVVAAGTGTTRVDTSREQFEVLAKTPYTASATKQGAEAVMPSRAGPTRVDTSREQFEAIVKRGPDAIVPLPLVSNAEFFLHNWASGMSMDSAFQTDVSFSAATAAEERRGLGSKPVRTITFQWNRNEIPRLDRLLVTLRKMTEDHFQMPIYQDQAEMAVASASGQPIVTMNTTRGRFFLGGRVAVVHFDGEDQPTTVEFYQILNKTSVNLTLSTNITTTIPVGALVIPMIDCQILLDVESDWDNLQLVSVNLTVEEVPGASQLPALVSDNPAEFVTYQNVPVFNIEPDFVNAIKRGYSRQGQKFRRGRANATYVAGDRARLVESYSLTGDRDLGWSTLRFFESRRGRLRTFFQIDQENLWTIQDASGLFINVNKLGQFSDFLIALQDGYIGFVLADGTYEVRQVTTVQNLVGSWRITLTDVLSAAIDPTTVVRFTRARKVRFSSDSFQERWSHSQYFACDWATIEALREQEFDT